MFSSQFAFVMCLVATWIIGSFAVPLLENDFFWYTTDQGTVVPAFLKGQPLNRAVKAVEDDVHFWHYLIGESEGREITPNCDECLTSFVAGTPTVFIGHGFGGGMGLGKLFQSAFTNRSEPLNIVAIDWGKLAQPPFYEYAANNVKPVGEYAARMINFLVEQGAASPNTTHFIGHSLGTHLANFISANLAYGKLHRVIATDPALPLFGQKDDSERIDPTDGEFVNVFHTAMGTLWDGGLAFTEPRGHVDFYPNGGKNQPGCPPQNTEFGSCSHYRAYQYLLESISNPTGFSSCKCTSWEEFDAGECPCEEPIVMGWDTPETAQGVYYLKTNSESPYSQN